MMVTIMMVNIMIMIMKVRMMTLMISPLVRLVDNGNFDVWALLG